MVTRYETVFILTPVLSDNQVKEAVKKVEDLLKGFGAKMKHTEDWGLRKLAYPIQKKSTGFYTLLEYEMEGEHINRLEIEMKRDERIMRFLTVRMDKHAVAFAESRRTKKGKEKVADAAE
ncbi:MAG: 30S ribosomal protein S6 [Flavobacteriales bacterium]|nr:30S ribosomal protein S6 [Flavobacteriales bacterium]